MDTAGELSAYDAVVIGDDGNGNVLALIDSETRAMNAVYEYGPFGELIRSEGPSARRNTWRFATKPQDNDSGLINFGYRHYQPSLGGWINRDPIAERGGLNLRAYVGNDPVNDVDVLGLKDVYVYIWDWKGTGVLGPGSSVGHVMVTDQNFNSILSQFPHLPGGGSSPIGLNYTLSRKQTYAEEGSLPSRIYQVHIPNPKPFNEGVNAVASKPVWFAYPGVIGTTHCAKIGRAHV